MLLLSRTQSFLRNVLALKQSKTFWSSLTVMAPPSVGHHWSKNWKSLIPSTEAEDEAVMLLGLRLVVGFSWLISAPGIVNSKFDPCARFWWEDCWGGEVRWLFMMETLGPADFVLRRASLLTFFSFFNAADPVTRLVGVASLWSECVWSSCCRVFCNSLSSSEGKSSSAVE